MWSWIGACVPPIGACVPPVGAAVPKEGGVHPETLPPTALHQTLQSGPDHHRHIMSALSFIGEILLSTCILRTCDETRSFLLIPAHVLVGRQFHAQAKVATHVLCVWNSFVRFGLGQNRDSSEIAFGFDKPLHAVHFTLTCTVSHLQRI